MRKNNSVLKSVRSDNIPELFLYLNYSVMVID